MINIKAYKCKLPIELQDESDRKCFQCKQIMEHEYFEYKRDGVNMYKMCNFCRGRRTKQWREYAKREREIEREREINNLNDTPTATEEDEYDDDIHDGLEYGTNFYKDAT